MRTRLGILALCLILALTATRAIATEIKPFGRGEMARLQAERNGRPFVLTLWSLECAHCTGTLKQLARLARQHPRVDLVVVGTDPADAQAAIVKKLSATGHARRATWVFDAEAPERLRHEIDPHWSGEMPRTYLVDADGHRTAYSGPVSDAELKRWLTRNGLLPRRQGGS